MIVYSTHFKIDQAQPFDRILEVIADWLSEKLDHRVSVENLKERGELRHPRGHIVVHARMHDFPSGAVIDLSHGDDKVPGREWVTSIGLRQDNYNSDIECTVNLTVVEISPLVQERVTPSRPLVVDRITKTCRLHHEVPGREIIELDSSSAPSCKLLIDSKDRKFPIIVVAPNPSGNYPVDLLYLQSQVVTLADIFVITRNVDPHRMKAILPPNGLPRNGGVTIVYPRVGEGQSVRAVHPQDTPDGRVDIPFEKEIFGHISLYTNFINRHRKIGPFFIQEAEFNTQKERIAERFERQKEDNETIDWLFNHIRTQEIQIAGLNADIRQYCAMFDESEERSRRHESEKNALHDQLAQLHAAQGPMLDLSMAALIERLALPGHEPKPSECLEFIRWLHADKVLVLPSAMEAAAKADRFKYGRRLLELLLTLVTRYRETLIGGGGDGNAKDLFGKNAFAAKESETTAENRRATELRTFSYKGELVTMVKHLKIGVNPSPVESIRVHFHWDHEDRKIVIGHCGEHLDLR